MNAVPAAMFGGGRASLRKQDWLYYKFNFSVILSIYIKPRDSVLGQPLQMGAHASNWGDSLNQRRSVGEWNTMVMMCVGWGCVD
jgi:hypothetical protein